MATGNPSDPNANAKAKFLQRYGGLRNVLRTDTARDSDPALASFDPWQACLFCNEEPCRCGPVQFSAWGVLVSFPEDGLKGWITNPARATISINERASREAYRWDSATAPESYVNFLRHKFRKENCIIKIKPLY